MKQKHNYSKDDIYNFEKTYITDDRHQRPIVKFPEDKHDAYIIEPWARRATGGHWCGYVTITFIKNDFSKKAKKLIGKNIAFYKVHGGITFQNYNHDHIIIGFDCAHSGDASPRVNNTTIKKYRTLNYVFYECTLLKKQIKTSLCTLQK